MQTPASSRNEILPFSPEPLPLTVTARYFRRQTSPRLVIGWILVALSVLLMAASRAGAQEAVVGEKMIADRQFLGAAARDGAIVRAGASLGDLSVATLNKQQEVAVVGASGDYLRILPPDGTFCLVPRARVNVRGEAGGERIGRVTETASVRVGSTINQAIDKTSARLSEGEEVKIIGEDSVYYHITPPKGVFFYVAKNDLLRVREVQVTETASGWKIGDLPAAAPVPTADPAPQPAETLTELPTPDEATTEDSVVADASPEPIADAMEANETEEDAPEVVAEAPAPSTQPSVLTIFQDLDARYIVEAEKDLKEQPLEELRQEYLALLEASRSDADAGQVTSLIEARLNTIELRQEALQDLLAMQAMREQIAERQKTLETEQQELAERAEAGKVVVYQAVGVVQPSSMQIGSGSLFRLCDPSTGSTLIYLRVPTTDAGKLTALLENFAGIKGEVVEDKAINLKYIQVAEAEQVEPADVFGKVAAEIIPPSLVQEQAKTE